jgi:hypothetical protein
MPRKAVLTDVNDVVQIRTAFEDFVNFCIELGWEREEIACWLHMMAEKMVEERD